MGRTASISGCSWNMASLAFSCIFCSWRIALWSCAESQNWRDSYGDEQSATTPTCCRFSLVGFLASGAFLGSTYFDFYFMIVACTAILKRVCYEEWAAGTDSAEDQETDDLPRFPLATQAGV